MFVIKRLICVKKGSEINFRPNTLWRNQNVHTQLVALLINQNEVWLRIVKYHTFEVVQEWFCDRTAKRGSCSRMFGPWTRARTSSKRTNFVFNLPRRPMFLTYIKKTSIIDKHRVIPIKKKETLRFLLMGPYDQIIKADIFWRVLRFWNTVDSFE